MNENWEARQKSYHVLLRLYIIHWLLLPTSLCFEIFVSLDGSIEFWTSRCISNGLFRLLRLPELEHKRFPTTSRVLLHLCPSWRSHFPTP
jgi:hypothetical protein